MRPVAFISAAGALRVEHLRAVGKAPSRKSRVNPVLKAEELPARVTHIDVPVTANRRLDDGRRRRVCGTNLVAANDRLDNAAGD